MTVSAKKTPAMPGLHAPQVSQAFHDMLNGFRLRLEKRRMRRRIESLDDHLRRDVGLDPADVRPAVFTGMFRRPRSMSTGYPM